MLRIQRAKTNDVLEIKKLLSETWVDTYSPVLSKEAIDKITSTWHDPKTLRKQIEDAETYFAVARNEHDEIIGIATAREIETKGRISLDRLYVDPSYQGQGIGKALLNSVINYFRDVKEVFTSVEALNKKAIEFYKKQGFKIYEEDQEEIIGGTTLQVIELVKRF